METQMKLSEAIEFLIGLQDGENDQLGQAIDAVVRGLREKDLALYQVLEHIQEPDPEDSLEWEMDGADLNHIEYLCINAVNIQ
jgi:hypothetical protein